MHFPRDNKEAFVKKKIDTISLCVPTKGSSAVHPTEKMEVIIECPNNISKQVDWFKRRMEEYRESFFKVCDIVEHSDCADIIKKLVEEERKRY